MKWKEIKKIAFFVRSIGTFKDTPIGKVRLSSGVGGQGIRALVDGGAEGPRVFLLTPEEMLKGLMEVYNDEDDNLEG